MVTNFDVILAPGEIETLSTRDLQSTTCVVFDVFRATSTIITALARGANTITPVSEIHGALEMRKRNPEVLLAGERDGVRILAHQTGGVDFDLGNSPREFTPERVRGKNIVLSTTNGSRALRACAAAETILVGSFLNLDATADYLRRHRPQNLLLVCSGTMDQVAFEDVLGAGALADQLWQNYDELTLSDSVMVARQLYQQHAKDLPAAIKYSRNGRRLVTFPELRGDLAWCLQRNVFPVVARMEKDGKIKATFR